MSNVKIEPCPKTGEGVNTWVNSSVLRMLRGGYTNATIYARLLAHAKGCGRDVRKDITHSIETGRGYLGIGKGYETQTFDAYIDEIRSLRDLLPEDPERQKQILEQNQEIRLGVWPYIGPKPEYNTMDVLYDLFGKNRICLGYNRQHAIITQLTRDNQIKFKNEHIKLNFCQFIVPTPMVGDYSINKSGKRSVRCLNNTCQRWFLVIEFDHISSLDDQVRLHYELAKTCELRMLIFSGNKSIHGWYDVDYRTEKENKKLMKMATELGADPMTWIRCQYVRFPNGINELTKARQEILYYNYGK